MARVKLEGSAERPSFGPAIKALQKVKASHRQLSPAQQETVAEITQRLRRLDNEVGRLISLNNRFLKRRPLTTEFDQSTDTVTFRAGDVEQKIKLKRANPAVPITARQLAAGGVYKPDTATPEQVGLSNDERHEFEGLLETYYSNAHRILKLVRTLPGLGKFECREITIVRNKLVEHPLAGDVYSFGFGTSGPVVRPLRKPDREWVDNGLVPNTESFIRKLTTDFNRTGGADG
jgi:hypothetical protein